MLERFKAYPWGLVGAAGLVVGQALGSFENERRQMNTLKTN